MGLLIGDHLQTMFDAAQESVGGCQFVTRLERDPVACGQNPQGFQGRTCAQLGMPTARDELLRLREELNLPNAAAADLDVMSFDGNLTLTTKRLHLTLHVMNIRERREIQMLAPDKRRNIPEQ